MLLTLNKLVDGDLFIVERMPDNDKFFMRLKELGLDEGTVGSVFKRSPLGGVVCIKFRSNKFALPLHRLEKMIVRVKR